MEDRQALDDIIYLCQHLKYCDTLAFELSSTGVFNVMYAGEKHEGMSPVFARNWLVHKLLGEIE
jgi:hypothetical protein